MGGKRPVAFNFDLHIVIIFCFHSTEFLPTMYPDMFNTNTIVSNEYPDKSAVSPVESMYESAKNTNFSVQKSMLVRLGYNLSVTSIHSKCFIESKVNKCEIAKMETVLHFNTSGISTCSNTNIAFEKKETCIDTSLDPNQLNSLMHVISENATVFCITPTYARTAQKADLTALCQTIMHVPNLLWIVVEDSKKETPLVINLLRRCKVKSVHLKTPTPEGEKARGVNQRNTALSWIRDNCSKLKNCTGAVYFMDDDNKYDLRLFDLVSVCVQCEIVTQSNQ